MISSMLTISYNGRRSGNLSSSWIPSNHRYSVSLVFTRIPPSILDKYPAALKRMLFSDVRSSLLTSDERCRRPITVDESVQGVSAVWQKVRFFVVERIAYKRAWTLVCCAEMLRFALMFFELKTYSLLSCFS